MKPNDDVRARFWRPNVRADVDDEIRFHLEARIRDLEAQGVSSAEARARAEATFGDAAAIRDEMMRIDKLRERKSRRRERFSDVLQDARITARSLARSPAFTGVAIACIALGVFAATVAFGAVNAVLLRPLPFHEPSRLVTVYSQHKARSISGMNVSWPDAMSWRERNRSFSAMGIWTWTSTTFSANDGGTGGAQRLETANVSADVFPILGVQPILGRGFNASDDAPGSARVILLGHALWQERYRGDSAIVGKTVIANARPHVVVGIMPAGFAFPENGQAWTPFSVDPADEAHGNRGYAAAIARLNPGVTLEAAQADLDRVSHALEQDFPGENLGWSAQAVDMRDDATSPFRTTLSLFFAAVALVLLIACANVANLMFARAASRTRETAVRLALGAGRGRLIRTVLTESLILSAAGGAIALLFARPGMALVMRAFPDGLPYYFVLEVDRRVVAFSIALAAVTSIVFGLLPALATTSVDAGIQLRAGARGTLGRANALVRRSLVVGEVALAVVLLVGAFLLTRSYRELLDTDLGFETAHIMTARFNMPAQRYPTDAHRRVFAAAVYQRIGALPGVTSVAAAQGLPFTGWNVQGEMTVEGKPRATGEELVVHYQSVTPAFFSTMGTPLLRGRTLLDSDRDTLNPVGVINETLARVEFAGRDPIGKRIKSGGLTSTQPWVTIVGVVKDIRQYQLPTAMGPAIYYPQAAWPTGTQTLAIRVRGDDPLSIAPSVRAAVKSLDPDMPLFRVQSMQQIVDRSLWRQRLQGQTLSLFGMLALILAAVGLYGIIAWSVSQRTREMGIRMALGAPRARVTALVLGDSLRLTAWGVAAGLAASAALSRVIAGFLYGISAFDLVAFTSAPVILASVAVLASYIPARRAARIDPAIAMRVE